MTRLLIHVEGQAEETFVNEVLAPHLYGCGYSAVSARLIGNARLRTRRGGIKGWNSVRKGIVNHLKHDPYCLNTTMVDYYGLPERGAKAWPGRHQSISVPFNLKAKTVQDALIADIKDQMGAGFDEARFVPYVMMYEFEGLLFSDCADFGASIGRLDLVMPLQGIRNSFSTPEEINDSPTTAPSKRIEDLLPGYEKPLMGSLIALGIGLEKIRTECPLFNAWMAHLEAWP